VVVMARQFPEDSYLAGAEIPSKLCDEFRHTLDGMSVDADLPYYGVYVSRPGKPPARRRTMITGKSYVLDDMVVDYNPERENYSQDALADVNEANARLLSAAPEMLAALCGWYEFYSTEYVGAPSALRQQTEEAIGKAQFRSGRMKARLPLKFHHGYQEMERDVGFEEDK
jgi:hypothetical protein